MSASKLRFYWRLQLAAHHMQKFADRELSSTDKITTAQVGVLTVVANQKKVSQKEVAVALGLNESAVTAMVKRLVSLKYIESKKSSTDGRVKFLSLTASGKDVQKNTKVPFKKINQLIESTLTNDEVELLAECFNKLKQSFENKT